MMCPIPNTPIQYDKGTYVGKKIKQFTVDDIITSETTFEQDMSSEWHYHTNPHFSHILLGGSKEIRKDGVEIQKAGKGLYYYPGIPHQNVNYQKNTRIFNLELTPGFFKRYDLSVPKESVMFDDHSQLNVNGLVQAMREYYLNDFTAPLALHQLCLSLIQCLLSKDETIFPEWAKKISIVMNDCWNQPLSLDFLSAQIGLHPVTISRYFSHYFNCSAGEYLRKIKIERALSLIRAGNYPLTEIAYRCGFADQAHFTKVFIHVTGWKPKQYQGL